MWIRCISLLAFICAGSPLLFAGAPDDEVVVSEYWQVQIVPTTAKRVRCIGLSQRYLKPVIEGREGLESIVLERCEFFDVEAWLESLYSLHPGLQEIRIGAPSSERSVNGDTTYSACTGGITPAAIECISRFENLERLTLAVEGHVITDEVAAQLGKLSQLRTLHLPFRVVVTNKGVSSLARLPLLSELVISGFNNSALQLLTGVKLKVLHLLECNVSLQGFVEIAKIESLTDLVISGTDNYEARLGGGCLSAIAGMKNLEKLVLVRCVGIEHHDLKKHISETSVTHLGVIYCSHKEPLGKVLGEGEQLLSLTLWGSTFQDEDLVHIGTLQELTHLDIRHCSAISVRGLHSLQSARALSRVEMPVRWQSLDDTDVGEIAKLKHLSYLKLPWSSPSPQGLAPVWNMVNLTHLDLSECEGLTDGHFKGIETLSNLTALILPDGAESGNRALQHIAGLSKLTSLRIVNWTEITDGGLAQVLAIDGIRKLALWGSPSITGEFLDVASEKSSLIELDIRYCDSIVDSELKSLGRLRLETLILCGLPKIDGSSIAELAGSDKIARIIARDNKKIDGSHLMRLAECTNLVYLDIRGCDSVTEIQESELREGLHPTVVVSNK